MILYVLQETADSVELSAVFPTLSGKWKNKEVKNEVRITPWEYHHIFLINSIQETLIEYFRVKIIMLLSSNAICWSQQSMTVIM